MAESRSLLVSFPQRDSPARKASYGATGASKSSAALDAIGFRRREATSTMFNTAFRRRETLTVEQAMLECSRVAQRLLRLLETRREDVRASVGAPRRAMGSQTTSRNVDAKRDRVLATLRGHLRYYTAQCESVQEHVLTMGSGESRCQRAFACLPCCTARATLVARHRRAVADAICISVRRATREYRVVEVHAGADASAMFKTLFEATEELAEVQSRLPKTAGRLPKRSALAACCLWTLCCGCCWMDDGSASASIKLKAKQKAAASRAAASPRHTGSGGGSSTGYRTLASPSPSSAGSAGASGRNDSAETPDADPLSIGPAAAPAGGDPLAASSSSSGHGRRSSAGHSRRSSGGSGHGRRLTGGGAATEASPRSGGPASDGGDAWVPRGSFGSDDGAFG
ncbi:hypothetical protein FNF27_06819 [Cafeteria roenbergensis]|uniref:Uncharacterized protein n=1 Tax=Cafeteria roenbergensis TaxID=33653 RepID=A0A5A8DYL8_CAFRO|nr:hypothetical protein FNF27_06819 [Cafeteria roenbergensis]